MAKDDSRMARCPYCNSLVSIDNPEVKGFWRDPEEGILFFCNAVHARMYIFGVIHRNLGPISNVFRH